jgi:hypothetical protein
MRDEARGSTESIKSPIDIQKEVDIVRSVHAYVLWIYIGAKEG